MAVKKRSKVTAEFNMSSLTDIIFLLLIFFMLTSSVVSPSAINLKLPNSSRTPAKATQKPLVLEVNEKTEYFVNGQTTTADKVKTDLQAAIARDGRAKNEITVVLNIHEKVQAQVLVDMVGVITELGAKMVLATKLEKTN
jgi:biopolymer transport protein ExbD